MNGQDCPQCGRFSDWCSTTNEWEYACRACDIRFNRAGERMPPFEHIWQLFPYTTVVPVLPPKDAA